MNQSTNQLPIGTGFNILEYLPKLIEKWWLIALCLGISLFGAWFYLHYKAVPLYNVRAQILVKDDNSNKSGDGLSLVLGAGGNNKDNEVAILKTRLLMMHLIRDYRLNENWYQHGQLRDVELLDPPFSLTIFDPVDSIKGAVFTIQAIDEARFQVRYKGATEDVNQALPFGKPFEMPGIGRLQLENIYQKDQTAGEFRVVVSSLRAQMNRLRASLTAAPADKQTSIIDLTLTTAIPRKGEYILTHFIDEYIQQNVEDKSRIADSTIQFIDERILMVNEELNKIEGNIQTFMQDRGLTTNMEAQSQLLLQNDNAYVQQLVQTDGQLELLDAMRKSLQAGQERLVAGNVLGDDPDLSALITRYNDLTLEKERLLLSYKADNPYVKNINNQLQSVRENVLGYINNKVANLQLMQENLKNTSNKVKGNIRQVPAQERAYLDLSRQQQLKQELYLFLLQKREETAVSKTNNIAGIRVIDPPLSDEGPFQPKPNAIWTAALLLGVMLPIGGIILAASLNTKVLTRRDVEKYTQVPVIAELSHYDQEGELVPFQTSRSALAEQFRGLRTNLQFLMPNEEDKVILVTSGMPGEGKSFTSLNLANVYAVSGLRVLLMEFDLRKPKLSKTYETKDGKGISNFLIEKNRLLDEIVTQVEENLFFSACGPIPPNPSELIMNSRAKELIEQARKQFDVVVIDAPPAGAVTDAQLLSKYADTSLFVVRAGYTPYQLVKLPEDMRATGKMNNLAIILNDINVHGNRYYYYGSTYYGYAYGYYGQEEKHGKKKRK